MKPFKAPEVKIKFNMNAKKSDVVVVGSGIIGLASAWAAHSKGHQVLVIDKEHHSIGASIRNFGFVTVTGQGQGETWSRAKRTREIWQEIAESAGINILQKGLLVCAQRPEAVSVLKELMATSQGAELTWLDQSDLLREFPESSPELLGAMYSPHEIRVESRLAIEQIKVWLKSKGIHFLQNSFATWTHDGGLTVNGQRIDFGHLVLAPGPELRSIVPEWVQAHQVEICRLSMLRIQPSESFKLKSPVMSDLSLVRYRGYSELNSSSALLSRLKIEQATHLEHGVHLIVVQSADGSLIVGDSHHYAPSIDPFVQEKTESLILEEMERVLNLKQYQIQERWVGYYPSAKKDAFIHECAQNVHLISVTSGTGMSTGFAIAAEWAEENL